MEKKKEIRILFYNLTEELINAISHGIGAILSIVGLILLIDKASRQGLLAILVVSIFGTTMILLYIISCIYHALSSKLRAKQILRVIDHCNVYFLVFGTVIPVALLAITSILGCIFLSIVAFVTIFGITMSIINIDKFQVFEVVCL